MTAPRSLTAVALVPWLLVGCATVGTSEQQAEDRLTRAEAGMNVCKQNLGLASAPTPTTLSLYDPRGGPVVQDPSQVKIKTLCTRELREVLDAQRALNELRRRGAGAGG